MWMLRLVFLITALLYTCGLASAQTSEEDNETPSGASSIERSLRYQQNIKAPELDYNLEPISDGHFKLIFVNRPSEYVRIKIYDIIGNLVLSEDKKYALKNEIEYNFNELNNKIYVVKVQSGDNNLTKKVNF